MHSGRAVALFALSLLACRSAPAEPTTPPAPIDAGARAPATHVIVEADHRNLTKMAVGDYVELPGDPLFAWAIKFENGSYFDPAPASDAGAPRYRASRTGIVRTLVSGDPKECMGKDGGCPLAQYAWSVTFQVE